MKEYDNGGELNNNKEPWKSTVYLPLPHRRIELRDDEGHQWEGWHDGATWFPVGAKVTEWRYKRYEHKGEK